MISPEFPGKGSDRPPPDTGADTEGLWDIVTQDITPLKGKNTVPRKPQSVVVQAQRTVSATVPVSTTKSVVLETPGHQEIDRRTAQKLKKGRFPVDVTVDLHGLTQAAAHKRMREVLLSAHARQQRCVLVITGKGKSGEGAGVIKRSVPEWLREPSLRAIVLRTEVARPEHGGGGALYVLLRRQRTSGRDE